MSRSTARKRNASARIEINFPVETLPEVKAGIEILKPHSMSIEWNRERQVISCAKCKKQLNYQGLAIVLGVKVPHLKCWSCQESFYPTIFALRRLVT